jgi:hypothetical protein
MKELWLRLIGGVASATVLILVDFLPDEEVLDF